MVVHFILPSVDSNNEYWSVKKLFIFLIRQRTKLSQKRSPSYISLFIRATFYFVVIIGLSFVVTTSYFINRTIVEQVSIWECIEDLHFDCFVQKDGGEWRYVDCLDNDQFSFIHSYMFLRFGVDFQSSRIICLLSGNGWIFLVKILVYLKSYFVSGHPDYGVFGL